MAVVLGAADLALSTVSCRIFTISSSLAQGTSFVDRLRNVRDVRSPESAANIPISNPAGSSMPVKIPWTISNKYYAAEVHFAIHTVYGLSQHYLKNVPAIIFVWPQGEPYKDDIKRIAQDLTGCEPEVCLAVKVPPVLPGSPDEDDSEIDAFLSSHGFEYVDATEEESSQRSSDVHEEEDFAGIPRISRVFDALGTIMWPSMETKTKKADKNVRQKGREFMDWAQSTHDDCYSTIEELTSIESNGNTRSRVREMQELARWLEEDDSFGGTDPWRKAATSAAISLSPTSLEFDTLGHNQTPDDGLGFDDDFTIFVSAPAVDSRNSHDNGFGRSSPEITSGGLSAALIPPHGELYRSLGSVSDFGDSDDVKRDKGDNDDDDVPTQDEIQATSSRIFGFHTTMAETDPGSFPVLKSSGSIPLSDTFSFDSELDTVEDDDPYEMANFDLSKVVGTLEEMKAEIGRMENEDERRKAAARVALGLVYGLEEDSEA